MPEPKFVVSVGSCSISGGAFRGCYNVGGSVDEVVPVNVYIPGCPPRPEAIIDGIILLLSSLKNGKAAPAAQPLPQAAQPQPQAAQPLPEAAP
jgi:NADH:ubiquinone oxidoreductase subunit B-like Fe-S oxidoreductase